MSISAERLAQLMEAFRESSAAASASAAAAPASRADAVAASIRVKLKPFNGGNAIEWHEWSKMHLPLARALGCARELTAADGAGIRVDAEDFDYTDQDAVRARKAERAWLSLLNPCIDTALEIV